MWSIARMQVARDIAHVEKDLSSVLCVRCDSTISHRTIKSGKTRKQTSFIMPCISIGKMRLSLLRGEFMSVAIKLAIASHMVNNVDASHRAENL